MLLVHVPVEAGLPFSLCHHCTGGDDDTAGLIPRSLKDLFAKTAQLGSPDDRQHCRICMSYVEIYNERLHDLLQPYKPNARLDPQVAYEQSSVPCAAVLSHAAAQGKCIASSTTCFLSPC